MEMAGRRVSEAASLAVLLLLCASSRPGLAATEDISKVSETGALYQHCVEPDPAPEDISRVSETGALYPTVLGRIQHFLSLRIRIQSFGD